MVTIRAQEYKATILAKVAPKGFNAHAFVDDLHMVKTPAPGQSSVRILTKDGGWIEFDGPAKVVRTWGTIGRAQILAAALAAALECLPEHLEVTGTVAKRGDAHCVAKAVENSVESLVLWWTQRGYAATTGPDGCWVSAGGTRIRDTGDRLECHGALTEVAIAAIMTKARDAWGGGMCLEGFWSQTEQDKIWIAAQRQGIEVENCSPSLSIRKEWQSELESADWKNKTISAIRPKIVEAQALIDAARGDRTALRGLPRPLQAFLASYLDDEQRGLLASRPLAEIIPELDRFYDLGAAELKSLEAEGRNFIVPRPEQTVHTRENAYSPR